MAAKRLILRETIADTFPKRFQESTEATSYLQKSGIEVNESGLGERIQQLSDEPAKPHRRAGQLI